MNKEELIEKLNKQELTDEQISEIEKVRKGELSEKSLIEKIENILESFINALNPPCRVLWYRAIIFIAFCSLLYALSLRPSTTDTQIWTVMGAFVGFIFGQKSSIFRF